jgi:hypothetical protein
MNKNVSAIERENPKVPRTKLRRACQAQEACFSLRPDKLAVVTRVIMICEARKLPHVDLLIKNPLKKAF